MMTLGMSVPRIYRFLQILLCIELVMPAVICAATFSLKNASTVATFDESGLTSVHDIDSGSSANFASDHWSLTLDNTTLRSTDVTPQIRKTNAEEMTYSYRLRGYRIEVVYWLKPGWRFVAKQIKVFGGTKPDFSVEEVVPVEMVLKDTVLSTYIPSSYEPQIGLTVAESRKDLPGKDYGAFLRLPENHGVMLVVQNPYLKVEHHGQSVAISYTPEMSWHAAWGAFASDIACISPYQLSGERLPREMLLEWKIPSSSTPNDGMDRAEIGSVEDRAGHATHVHN